MLNNFEYTLSPTTHKAYALTFLIHKGYLKGVEIKLTKSYLVLRKFNLF